MAATISDLANGTSIAAGTTCATGATVTANVGDWLLVVCSAGAGTLSGSSATSVVDSDGVNVYTQRASLSTISRGSITFFTCPVTSALSGDTITVTFFMASPATEKAVQVYRIQPGAGEAISFVVADTVGVQSSTTTHSANTVSVTNGDIIFGGAGIETDDAVTGDSDTTNGSWSAIISRLADNGADASTVVCCSQYKTVTATGNQSWACTTASARGSYRSYIILRSAPVVAATGGLHGIEPGIGDTGEGARVPQTLHTVNQGICT